MTRHTFVSGVLATLFIGVLAIRVTADGQPQVSQDTLGALLVEVRGLRTAMEQVASAGPRVQLAMGRLQIQEQRIAALARRADSLHDAAGAAQKRVTELQDRVALDQRVLERGEEQEHRSEIEMALTVTKRELSRATAELQRLQGEESDAATQVANEQARWVEINQRLEELDRALTRR